MPRNGSGSYSRAVTPPVNGDVATADDFNDEMDDIATALSNSLARNGEATPTANLPMGGFKHTGLAAGSANGDSVRYEQLILNRVIDQAITTTGSSNAYVLSSGLSLSAYASGQAFLIIANFSNTGAATIDVDGLGAKSITKNGTTALASGDIVSGRVYLLTYDGTQFQLYGVASGVYQPLDATLTALAALSTSAGQYIRATGTDTFTMDSYATVLSNIGAANAVSANNQNGNYTLALSDANAIVWHNNATGHGWNLPTNASVAFPVGTQITLYNTNGGGGIALTPAGGVNLYWTPSGATGARNIAGASHAVLRKFATNDWIISGDGVS